MRYRMRGPPHRQEVPGLDGSSASASLDEDSRPVRVGFPLGSEALHDFGVLPGEVGRLAAVVLEVIELPFDFMWHAFAPHDLPVALDDRPCGLVLEI